MLLTRSQSREHGPSVLGEWMDWCESTGAMPRQQQQTQPSEGESWDQISKAELPCRSRTKFPFLRVSMFEQHCTPYITRLSLGNLLIRSNSSASGVTVFFWSQYQRTNLANHGELPLRIDNRPQPGSIGSVRLPHGLDVSMAVVLVRNPIHPRELNLVPRSTIVLRKIQHPSY